MNYGQFLNMIPEAFLVLALIVVFFADFALAKTKVKGCTLEIDGDATGCGKVKFDQAQDISGVKLTMKDADSFDKEAAWDYYQILDAPNGCTGKFDMSEVPHDWEVKYTANGKSAYLRPARGTKIIFR